MPTKPLQLLISSVFISFTGLVLLAYYSAWSGDFHFDDAPNLEPLTQFLASGDAWQWITIGTAGPTGRPIALASFLLDAPYWPHDPSGFLYTNTLIHLLNGLLVALVLLRLARSQMMSERDAQIVALVAAALWLAAPLLASSVLFVVQRMTLLAATWMWAGFWVYLLGREYARNRPVLGTVVMTVGVMGGTMLGVLSKENAALLPLLVLVTELTLLKRQPLKHRGWHLTRWILLGLPTLAVFLYLAWRIPGGLAVSPARGYSVSERLATQSLILWDYLRLLLLPHSAAFSPFHDTYPLSTWSARGYLASIAAAIWVGLAAAAIGLRHRWPLFAFAVLWYLAAHLLESTVILLDLYFQHRNYVPAVGPIFALTVGAWQWGIKRKQQRGVGAALGVYGGLMLLVLVQTTQLWGQPRIAAEVWYNQNPDSLRAAIYLANHYVREHDLDNAVRVMDQTRIKRPESVIAPLQVLYFECQRGQDERILMLLNDARQRALHGMVNTGIPRILQILVMFAREQYCSEALTLDALAEIVTLAGENPAVRAGRQGRAHIYLALASIHHERRDLNATMQALQRALEITPDLAILSFAISVLNSAGLYEQALEFALAQNAQPPSHPLKRIQWLRDYDAMLEAQRNLIADRNSE